MAKLLPADAFTGSSIDTSKWNGSNFGTWTVSGGVASTGHTVSYSGLRRSTAQDARGNELSWEFWFNRTPAGADSSSGSFTDSVNANNWTSLGIENGALYWQVITNGSTVHSASATYNSTNHRWMKLAVSGGGEITAWTSTNGLIWTQLGSAYTPSWTPSSVLVGYDCGNWQSDTGTTTTLDNFNIDPSVSSGMVYLSPTSTARNQTVTNLPVYVTLPHLGATTTVHAPQVPQVIETPFKPSSNEIYLLGVGFDAVFVAPDWFKSDTSGTFEPTVTTGPRTVEADFLASTSTVHTPGIFSGYGILLPQWTNQPTVFEPIVTVGSVTVGPTGTFTKTTALYAPSAGLSIAVAALAPTTVVQPPGPTTLFLATNWIEPTGGAYLPLIGTYQLLTEPDEPVWGASGGYSARVDVLDPAGNIIASTASRDSGITLVSGNVNEDCTQGIMRQLQLRLLLQSSDDGTRHPLLPAKAGDPLDPRTGGKLAVYAGPLRPSGLPAWIKLGVYAITNVSASSTASGDSLAVTGMSLESEISASKFYKITAVEAGTTITDAILQLVREAIPEVQSEVESSPITTIELNYTDNDDRLKAIQELARSIGFKAYFDREGRFRCHRRMIYGDMAEMDPEFTFTEGRLATVRDVTRELDGTETYNGVIVVGEPLDGAAPVRAELWDTDPRSPTYYDPANPGGSTRGPRPKKVVSNLIRTQEQAMAAAEATLAEVLTWVDRIRVDFAANPNVECEDIVWVERTSMGVAGTYEVEKVTHDLLGGRSSATCIARGHHR